MQYGELFTRTWWLVWQHKLLWLLGLMLGVGGIIFNLFSHLFLPGFFANLNRTVFAGSIGFETYFQTQIIVGGASGLFLVLAVTWVINVFAEGATICSVVSLERGKSVTIRGVIAEGCRLLGRYVAIDTILFLPVFILFLVLALIVFGIFIVLAAAVTQAKTDSSVLIAIFIIGGLCLFFVLLLLPVITLLILALRLLAFRSAAIEQADTKLSITDAWKLLRSNLWSFILLAVLLWGLRYVVGLPFRMAGLIMFIPGILVFISEPLDPNWSELLNSPFLTLVGLILVLVGGMVNSILNAFSSSAWTIAYEGWVQGEPGLSGELR